MTPAHPDPNGAGPPAAPLDDLGPAGQEFAGVSIGDEAATAPDAPVTGPGRRAPADSSTGELLHALTDDIRSLVQSEVASARREVVDRALAARPAAALLGGAAVLGALAAGTSAVVLVRALDKILPPTSAAVVATALLGGGAAALGKVGVAELRLVGSPVPERTIESVKADVAAFTEAASG